MKILGITLIALIITIVVLLILAGTAVTIGLDGGQLFSRANNAVTKWNSKVSEENEKINEVWDILNPVEKIKQVNDTNPGTLEVSGTTYTINSIEDLVAFAYDVNNNNNLYENKTVQLGCSLDFQNDKSYMNPNALYSFNGKGYFPNSSGTPLKTILTDTSASPVGWAPIGKGDNDGFSGIFDGKNFDIINLYQKPFSYGGLFGKTNKAITIKNLGLVNCNISSGNEVGGILGYAGQNGTIVNCYCTGNIEKVSYSQYTGGLLGFASNGMSLINCYNNCTISSRIKCRRVSRPCFWNS